MELLYFSAVWCPPCRTFGPIVERVTGDMSLKLTKVDVDADTHTAWQYKVMAIPTLILLEDGKTRKRTTAPMSEDELWVWLTE